MTQILLVALGGALGSVARYGVGLMAARIFGIAFPWGTLAVNILGGLLMGILAARLGPQQEELRLLLGVGLLGGFTTFSTFSLEALRLMEHAPFHALTYVGASLVLSLAACWAGLMLGRI